MEIVSSLVKCARKKLAPNWYRSVKTVPRHAETCIEQYETRMTQWP